ncbi:thiamine pyrophosphate-binding protein [Streptomyces sp. NPDC057199]|uniref:thiamine pyrophosphate-binding protein n=1 Tax=Streptomyces sp. NPDC057199 TaxID=3346047 RepID=UPI0036326D94
MRRRAVHESEQALRDADLVVALGCRFSEFTTKRWTLVPPEADLVHVDIDPVELGRIYPPRVGLASDAAALPPLPAPSETVSSAAPAEVVQRLADRDGLVLIQDVATFGPWILRHVGFDRARSHYGSPGGAMAWGLPAAMGMALARPEERVVALSGDGSFWMVAQDFETCVRERIPVVNLVVNNFAYGNTRDRQRLAHDERYSGVFLDNPDFAAFAGMLGGYGARVTRDTDLPATLVDALAQPGPSIIDIVQDPMEGLPSGLTPPKAH